MYVYAQALVCGCGCACVFSYTLCAGQCMWGAPRRGRPRADSLCRRSCPCQPPSSAPPPPPPQSARLSLQVHLPPVRLHTRARSAPTCGTGRAPVSAAARDPQWPPRVRDRGREAQEEQPARACSTAIGSRAAAKAPPGPPPRLTPASQAREAAPLLGRSKQKRMSSEQRVRPIQQGRGQTRRVGQARD
jgi:hypothetical protein